MNMGNEGNGGEIGREKYVSFTTYRKDGSAKAVPVWIADLGDGTLGFTTFSTSYKAKRLANDNRVLLEPSDSRGQVKAGSTPSRGTARLVVGGSDFERVRSAINDKYGWQVHVVKLARLVGKYTPSDSAVIVTLD